jgi:hypothetical protein
MTTTDRLIAELTEARDRARSIAATLEGEAHLLRTALVGAAAHLDIVPWDDDATSAVRSQVASALAATA